MTTKDRLLKFINLKGLTPKSFENACGLGNGFVSKVGFSIRKEKLELISKKYPELNISWLQTGVGEMLKEDNEHVKIIDTAEDYERAMQMGLKLIPEVEFEFSAGSLEIFENKEFVKRYWFLPDCTDCDGIAVVRGNSMLPTYPPGCWVALKRVGVNIDEPYSIDFGNAFGVVLQDPATLKYHGHIKILRRYNDDPERSKKYWIARSLNSKEFDDFDIKITDIRGLWIVKQHIVSDTML